MQLICYWTSLIIYNLYFHPLRSFPGSRTAAATRFYMIFHTVLGKRHKMDEHVHTKYGEIVRVAPNELSFIGNDAWRDIYMHRQGQPQMRKAGRGGRVRGGAYNIINAPDDIHARQRKALSHAFSERAVGLAWICACKSELTLEKLREQEPLIKSYIDLLISNIREDARENRPSNMVSYLNWVTFDLVGDLSFAQSFHALKTRTTHPWISTFFSGLRLGMSLQQLATISIFRPLLMLLIIPFRFSGRQKMLGKYCEEHIAKRIESGSDRPDFLGKVLEQNSKMDDKAIMSRAEINATFNILMIAGSETTATLLAGCTYLLQRNPTVLKKLKDEIIGAFKSDEEITLLKVSTKVTLYFQSMSLII